MTVKTRSTPSRTHKLQRMTFADLVAELRGECIRFRGIADALQNRLEAMDRPIEWETSGKARGMSDFASRFRSVRRRLRLSKCAFAQLLGVHRNTVNRWETLTCRAAEVSPDAAKALRTASRMTLRKARARLIGRRAHLPRR